MDNQDYHHYKLLLGTFIGVALLYLLGCLLARWLCKSTPSTSTGSKEVRGPTGTEPPAAIQVDQTESDIAGNLQQILDDNCFISDMGRILCQDQDYQHSSLRGVERASVDQVGENQDPGCPGYVYPGIYIIEPCDDSRYNYMEDLDWDGAQREWDDFPYGRFSAELDAVRDRFPDNLYSEEMRGKDGLDVYFEYKEYVQDPYMNNHEGEVLFDNLEIPTVTDYYTNLYGNDSGGEIWQK